MTELTSGDIYKLCKEKGIETDSHASDLYIPVTPETTEMVNSYRFKANVTKFRSNIAPHDIWYEIPFGYTPFWDAVINRNKEVK